MTLFPSERRNRIGIDVNMPEDVITSRKRLLEPMDRAAEVLCGLIMVMTFTLTLNGAEAGRNTVREMLFAALGCNLAWGIIDGTLYVMGCNSERQKAILSFDTIRRTASPEVAHRVIADMLPPLIVSVLGQTDLEMMRQRLTESSKSPSRSRVTKDDWLGGLGVFLIVFLSTFPVVIPFIVMHEIRHALRTSNGITLGLLFLTGFLLGSSTGRDPWRTGLFTLLLGSTLVAIALVLGG